MTQLESRESTSVLSNYEEPQLETVTLEVLDSKIAVLTINRPGRMNSMVVKMFEEFNTAAHALRDTDARR
ncbi:enoyl-CoA hydratase/carnithine racemase [Prescottella agglutinans]|jgi:enoyl-CoA hydratase/carnithine racemase|uniref:Enoyl-CoA hydratase/carnithine racemase n=1 Tax=Prescottella agglutinans TaxID=1644129 RepID=A0ABT6ML07_9NOCA|nr:enoyl-CoA hydratase/carnithine racemase [Prescottella agglutinans]